MRKHILLSTAALVVVTSLNAAENIESMFSEGKVSGQIREFSISRDVTDTRPGKDDYIRTASAVGGYLKYETADFAGLSLGTAFYTTNGLFIGGEDRNDYTKTDPTLLGPNNESYSLLGEAYLQYKRGNTTFKGGRQKLNTPLAGADDARMLPNLFEAYLLINTDVEDTTLIAGHVTKFAQGTFGRVYNGGILAVTSGYSFVDSRNQVGQFVNMGTYAVGESTAGVTVASATYIGIDNIKLQAWDYYAHDILNAIYLQADTSWNCRLNDSMKMYASAQLLSESEVGDEIIGEVDAMYWAVKLGSKFNNFNIYAAYSSNDESEGAFGNGAVVTPWGGMPAFTQGMVTRHQFLAGTDAIKAVGSYNWKDFGPKLSTILYYSSYDMSANSGYGIERTATEAGFDFIYYPEMVKNLQLRLRGNFPTDFYEAADGAVDWSEYRFIANYNF
ncbi:MAG: OprD family outer membrane porin [Campylobacterota bacterium]|nr:OprD family outer membrane porin [Campylobacterota bacterium]